MITDKDIEKLKTVFATKDDLKQFATKADLIEIRNELASKASKEDLRIYATKADMNNQFNSFAREVAQMLTDFAEAIDKRFDRLEQIIDEGTRHLNKHDRRIELHEDRITSLEVSVFKSSGQG